MDQDYNWVELGNYFPGVHDSAPSCNNMWYTYYKRYGDPNWHWKPSSCGADWSGFTDNHFDAGATPIRMVHLTELRERIDGLRLHLGLLTFIWTDERIEPGVTPIKAVHLTELRAALNEAYTKAGREAPSYTDQVIVPLVTPIRAVHLTELQRAVVALEN